MEIKRSENKATTPGKREVTKDCQKNLKSIEWKWKALRRSKLNFPVQLNPEQRTYTNAMLLPQETNSICPLRTANVIF
jgi:hypothetical protein